MKKLIYADNAATTQLSKKAFEAMLPYLQNEYGNASQSYSFSRSAKLALRESREIIAKCIGALPEEIFITSGGTESDNWIIQGALRQGLPIITSVIEHHAILRPCEWICNKAGDVSYLPVNQEGVVCFNTLNDRMNGKKGITSIMFANNEIGTIQPINEIALLCHRKGWLFHTDAVQAVGHTPINVETLGIDMLSASAHKFNGPKGIGFLYIRRGVKWVPLILGGSQESGFRAGTENVAGVVGMAAALKENIDSLEGNMQHIFNLEEMLMSELSQTCINFQRNGANKHLAGNISLSFPGHSGEAIMHRLDLLGISVSTGSACDSKETNVSHVLKAINLSETMALGTIRITLGKNNTEEDVNKIVQALCKILL